MSRRRVFEPVITTLMSADPIIHGEEANIQYKLSYGFELGNTNAVFKVQMVGDGYIKGRQAPSYSDSDFDRIIRLRDILRERFQNMDNRLRDIEITEDEMNDLLREV